MIDLGSPSRVLRTVSLAAAARTLLPGEEIELDWPLAEGIPWRQRLAAIVAEASLRVTRAPGAFTDEQVARDAERAGLRLVRRVGDRLTFRRDAARPGRSHLRWADVTRLLGIVLHAEHLLRLHASPDALLAVARATGARKTGGRRADLRVDLALIEPLVPGHRGCLRRVIAEVLGDPEAAREPVLLGLTPYSTGHASFAHTTPWAPEHPVTFTLTDRARRSIPPPP